MDTYLVSSKRNKPSVAEQMGRIEGARLPLAELSLACGTRVTRPWTRDGFHGYVPGMAGHIISGYHGRSQDCSWRLESHRLVARIRPGTVTVVPESHDGQWDLSGPIEVSHVYLTSARLQSCCEAIISPRRVELIARVGFEDSTIASLLAMISHEALIQDGAPSRLFIDRALDLLCLQLIRGHSSVGSITLQTPRRGLADWQIRRITAYMREQLDEDLGLDELANIVNLTRFHFCTSFRLATGTTPYKWLTAQRIERAKELLSNPHMRITDVASSVGYKTLSAFTATFRKYVGVTPSQFRLRL
jgi:AraC family transcriptional regulator